MPANSTAGLCGSSVSPEQPVFSSTNSTRVQVLPPSIVRYTPRSCCGPVARPSAHTYTMSALVGLTRIRPMRPVWSSPMCCQVMPASVDLYTPSPITSASRMAHASPVPAHTMFGLDDATASAPMACTGSRSNTGPKLCPPSADFHTPPDAEPRYQMAVSPGTPDSEAMRPPLAGPANWKCSGCGAGGGPPRPRRWAREGAAATGTSSRPARTERRRRAIMSGSRVSA